MNEDNINQLIADDNKHNISFSINSIESSLETSKNLMFLLNDRQTNAKERLILKSAIKLCAKKTLSIT